MLAVHLVRVDPRRDVDRRALVAGSRHCDPRRDGRAAIPVVICGAAWFVAVVVERVVHLMPLASYRDLFLDTYVDWALVVAVHLPLIAVVAVIGSIGWSIAVKPHVERLPSGTFVLPDSDPITMLRNDLADWVGDPTLQLAFADGTGGGSHRPARSTSRTCATTAPPRS